MSLNMKTLVVGALGVNCYILHKDGSSEAAVIDPGGSEEAVWQHIQEDGLNLKAILNTHAHADHIGAIDFLREKTGAKLYIHEADAPMLRILFFGSFVEKVLHQNTIVAQAWMLL